MIDCGFTIALRILSIRHYASTHNVSKSMIVGLNFLNFTALYKLSPLTLLLGVAKSKVLSAISC